MLINRSQSSLEAQESVNTLCTLVEQVLRSNELLQERLNSIELGSSIGKDSVTNLEATQARLPSDGFRQSANGVADSTNFGYTAFEYELNNSRVYRRSRKTNDRTLSIVSTAGRTASWSILSGLSISDISNLSVLAIPIHAEDILNPERYQFGDLAEQAQRSVSDWPLTSQSSNGPLTVTSTDFIKDRSFNLIGQGNTPKRVFGVELLESILYANIRVKRVIRGIDRGVTVVPIVVGRCCDHLKKHGGYLCAIYLLFHSLTQKQAMGVKNLFFESGSAPQIEELKILFDSADTYGKDLNMSRYSVYDIAGCLLRYLKSLPQSIVPWIHYRSICEGFPSSLLAEVAESYMEKDLKSYPIDLVLINGMTPHLNTVLRSLDSHQSKLLVYIMDFVRLFMRKSEIDLKTVDRLVATLQPALLSGQPDEMSETEYRVAHLICVNWLVVPQAHPTTTDWELM